MKPLALSILLVLSIEIGTALVVFNAAPHPILGFWLWFGGLAALVPVQGIWLYRRLMAAKA